MKRHERRRIATAAAVLASATLVVGCAEDDALGYRETLTFGSGNAMAANRAIHTIDPWPHAAANQTIPGNGPRTEKVIEVYENGPLPEESTSGGSQVESADPVETAGKTTD